MTLTPDILAHVVGSDGAGRGWDAATQWAFDPLALFVVLLPGLLYARGLRKWKVRPRPLKRWQPYFFYAGLFVSGAALISPIDALADDLFVMHMTQHLLLLMIAPPLILLGSPTTLILLGLSQSVRQRVVKPLLRNWTVRAAYGVVTFPAITWVLFVTTTWSWHFVGGAYDAAVGNYGIHTLQHVTFITAGMLLWLVIVDPRPMRSRLTYPFRMIFITITEFQNVLLGVAITFQPALLYSSYAEGSGLWGITPLNDQQVGGVLMWGGGVMMLLIALVVTGVVWFDKMEEQARREEKVDVSQEIRVRSNGHPILGS